jgi:hypothetical protein
VHASALRLELVHHGAVALDLVLRDLGLVDAPMAVTIVPSQAASIAGQARCESMLVGVRQLWLRVDTSELAGPQALQVVLFAAVEALSSAAQPAGNVLDALARLIDPLSAARARRALVAAAVGSVCARSFGAPPIELTDGAEWDALDRRWGCSSWSSAASASERGNAVRAAWDAFLAGRVPREQALERLAQLRW